MKHMEYMWYNNVCNQSYYYRIYFLLFHNLFLLFFLFDSVCPHIFRRITCFTHPHFVFPLGIRVGDLPYGIWPIWDSFDLNHKITIARFALCFPLYRNSQYYLFPLWNNVLIFADNPKNHVINPLNGNNKDYKMFIVDLSANALVVFISYFVVLYAYRFANTKR